MDWAHWVEIQRLRQVGWTGAQIATQDQAKGYLDRSARVRSSHSRRSRRARTVAASIADAEHDADEHQAADHQMCRVHRSPQRYCTSRTEYRQHRHPDTTGKSTGSTRRVRVEC